MKLVRPELETCPVCNAKGSLSVHCYYARKLIDFIGGRPAVHEITILRVCCNSCGGHHTHAVLPDFIIPYSCYSLFFILRVLGEYFLHLYTVEQLCARFSITEKQLYKWIHLWVLHKKEWLGILEDTQILSLSFLKMLVFQKEYSVFASAFLKQTGRSFLQSHANPPETAHFRQKEFAPDYLFSPTT